MSSSLCDPRQYQHLHHINIGQEIKIKSQWKHKGSRNTSGFDAFLNVVVEDAVDENATDESGYIDHIIIRGNSSAQFETLERVRT
jgi:small nuclear ribonucleoprotein (snRNP)-like protein